MNAKSLVCTYYAKQPAKRTYCESQVSATTTFLIDPPQPLKLNVDGSNPFARLSSPCRSLPLELAAAALTLRPVLAADWSPMAGGRWESLESAAAGASDGAS
jgi:hypothetical protein